MVSSSGTFVNRLLMSKEHRNVLAGSRLQFWIKLANVNESFTEYEEYNFRTGIIFSMSRNVAAFSCCTKVL